MHDRDVRIVVDAPTRIFHAPAQVDILEIHEKTPVEESGLLKGVFAGHQTRTRDPVHVGGAGVFFLEVVADLEVVYGKTIMKKLAKSLRDKGRETSPGKLEFAVAVKLARAHGADVGVGQKILEHFVDAVVKDLRVAIQKEDEIAAGVVDPEVVGLRETEIGACLDADDLGQFLAQAFKALVLGAVVDDNDLKNKVGFIFEDGPDAVRRILRGLKVDDDDAELDVQIPGPPLSIIKMQPL